MLSGVESLAGGWLPSVQDSLNIFDLSAITIEQGRCCKVFEHLNLVKQTCSLDISHYITQVPS